MPKAAPRLYTSCRVTQSPATRSGMCAGRERTTITLVTRSSTTIPSTTPQNIFRLAPLAIFLFRLALDAETGVRQRVQPLEPDLVAALVTLAELVRLLVEPTQRLVHMPEVTPLLRREEKLLLPLHGVGPLVRHMKGIR